MRFNESYKSFAKQFAKQNDCKSCEAHEQLAKQFGFSSHYDFRQVCKTNPFDKRLYSAYLQTVGLDETNIDRCSRLKDELLRHLAYSHRFIISTADSNDPYRINDVRLRGVSYCKIRDKYSIRIDFLLVSASPGTETYSVEGAIDITSHGNRWHLSGVDGHANPDEGLLLKCFRGARSPLVKLSGNEMYIWADSDVEVAELDSNVECMFSNTYGISDDSLAHCKTMADVQSLLRKELGGPDNDPYIVFTVPRHLELKFKKRYKVIKAEPVCYESILAERIATVDRRLFDDIETDRVDVR